MTTVLLLLTTAATVVLNCPSHVSPVEARTLLSLKSTPRSFSIPRRNSFGLVVSSSSSIVNTEQRNNIDYFLTNIRGGGSADSDDNDEDDYEEEEEDDTVSVKVAVEDANNDTDENNEYDSEEEEEEEEEEYDSESEEDEDSTTTTTTTSTTINPFGAMLKSSILSKSNNNGEQGPIIMEYDELLTPPPMQQMGITIGVMLLSNCIDIHNSRAIKIARFAFLSYIITVQIFLLYVNWQAKRLNDRTPIKISNPLMSMLPPGLLLGGSGGGGGTNFMIQTLADQLLSSSTTVLEYDMKQMKKMNGSLLFPMILLYFLHFKLKQVQPLLMQTATGFANLIYSPLFQVYILGRNLERPFKPPVTTNPMMEALMKQQTLGGASAVSGEGSVDEEDADDDEDDDDESSGDGDTEEEDGVVVEEI